MHGNFNVAILSPSRESYSETFIQAHKRLLKGIVFYYYGGEIPNRLEGGLVINSRRKRIIDIVKGHFRLNRFSLEEQALITSFRKNKIQVVLAEYGGTAHKILPLTKELKIPVIVHFHGHDASQKAELELNNSYKQVFDYATFVVVVSRKMYSEFLTMGCPEEKLKYNVYGPREEFLNVRPTFKNQQFISIGRFVDKKAPYYLILSFKKVVKKFPEAKLFMAGNGELWNTCKNLIEFYGLGDNIFLLGVIDSQMFRQYLEDSVALIQHSITAEDGDSEGTPLSILEAGAAGLPVVATNHAGIPDVVIDGETGWLVAEHDVMNFAERMLNLLGDTKNAKRMGSNARERIRAEFNMHRHISVLNDLIKRAVKKSKDGV